MGDGPARALVLEAPGSLALRELAVGPPERGEAVVRVAGCGVCHTDLSFYTGAVRTRAPLPLVLGHEIAGTIEAVGAGCPFPIGARVLVPAVLPCGTCDLCRAGRDNACLHQKMPGNDLGGGFATHVTLPARDLIPLPADLGGHRLAELAVIADAVTTPYQALRRVGAQAGDLVVVVGIGGIGIYGVQLARALDAAVAAVDVDPAKLERAAALGARWCFNPRELDGKAIRKRLVAESGISSARWRILEMSGTKAGQELAWTLLPPAGTLGVIGFTMDRPDIRLSNLMALDATAVGSWGCSPRHYPAVVDLVLAGHVHVQPFVEPVPLDQGAELLRRLAAGEPAPRRPVLVPDGEWTRG